MKLIFSDHVWEDYLYWQKTEKNLKRINTLVNEIKRSPFEGIGKTRTVETCSFRITGPGG